QGENLFINPSEELTAMCQLAPEVVEGTAAQIGAQIKNAFETMQRELASEGITLHTSGLEKIKRIAQLNTRADIRLVGTWRKIYEHANSLGALTSEDVTVPKLAAPVVQPEPVEQKPTMNDLMALKITGSRDLA